jgi:enoyl-CoA hydratase/carnithine racemase
MKNAPLALVASKRVINEQHDWPLAEMFERQAAITDDLISSRTRVKVQQRSLKSANRCGNFINDPPASPRWVD